MKTLFRIACIVAVAALSGVAFNSMSHESLPLLAPPSQNEEEISEDLKIEESDIMDLYHTGEAIFVDARSRDAYEKGRIPGSFSLPYKVFEEGGVPEEMQFLPRDMLIVIYCDGADCHASEVVAEHLPGHGFDPEKVKVFHGGWKVWQEMGGEVESDGE